MAGFDKTTQNLNANNILTIEGDYTQNKGNSFLKIAFDANDSMATHSKITNSKLKANDYTIQGGNLEYVTIFKNGNNAIKSGDVFDINLDDLNEKLQNFDKVFVEDTNTLTFEIDKNDKTKFVAKYKEGAFATGSGNAGFEDALENLLDSISKNGNQQYNDFFGNLDVNTDRETFKKIVESLEKNAPTPSLKDNFVMQNKLMLDNTSFLLKSFTQGTPQKVAMTDSDLGDTALQQILKDFTNKSEISVNAGYGYLDQKDYISDTFSFNVQGKKEINDTFTLGSFFDYSYTNGDGDLIHTKNNLFTAGLSGLYSLQNNYSLLGGLSLGFGFNETQRGIIGLPNTLNGDYNTYNFSTQIGVAKDISIPYFTLKPTILVNYIGAKQDSFSEEGMFAQSYQGDTYHNFSTSIGANLGYDTTFKNHTFYFNTLAFYNLRFNNKLTSIAAFKDAPNSKLKLRVKLINTTFTLGLMQNYKVKLIWELLDSLVRLAKHTTSSML